jgi:hypothetical protein
MIAETLALSSAMSVSSPTSSAVFHCADQPVDHLHGVARVVDEQSARAETDR